MVYHCGINTFSQSHFITTCNRQLTNGRYVFENLMNTSSVYNFGIICTVIIFYAWVTPGHEPTTTCKSVGNAEICSNLVALDEQTPYS